MSESYYSKPALVAALQQEMGLTASQANKAVTTVFSELEEALSKRQSVRLGKIGTLKVKDFEGREGVHPMTREPYPKRPFSRVVLNYNKTFNGRIQ